MRTRACAIWIAAAALTVYGATTPVATMATNAVQTAGLAPLVASITTYSAPEDLRRVAQQLAGYPQAASADALQQILERCAALDKAGPLNHDNFDITRAHAIYSLIKLSPSVPACQEIIGKYFQINQPVCLAMLNTRYEPMFALLDGEVNRLLTDQKSLLDVAALKDNPHVAFALTTHSRGIEPAATQPASKSKRLSSPFGYAKETMEMPVAPDTTLVDAMLDAALVCEWSRAGSAFATCQRMLRHQYAYLWEKQAYRAIANLNMKPSERYAFLLAQLRGTTGREQDACAFNWAEKDSILFSLRNISAEAFLVFTLWRQPDLIERKATDIVPSLSSPSFTARAAAIDCLASTPLTTKRLAGVLNAQDAHTRRFLALRLATETNFYATTLLNHLMRDNEKNVAAEAKAALAAR